MEDGMEDGIEVDCWTSMIVIVCERMDGGSESQGSEEVVRWYCF